MTDLATPTPIRPDEARIEDPPPALSVVRPLPRWRRALRAYTRSRAIGWTLVVVLIAVWQASSTVSYNPSMSSPSRIAETWWFEIREGTLLDELIATLRTMAIGFAIAFPAGVGLGFLMGRVRVVWGVLEPLVEILRLTPMTAMLPIYILFLGLGDSMKIAVFLTTAIFPMILTSYAGARSVSRILSETAQTFRLGWWQTQREIALPAAIPYILVGVRQSLGMSLVMAVVIGMLAGNDGIGYYILFAQQSFNIPALLAGVVTVAIIGYLLNAIFLLLEKRLTRWRRTDSSDW